ncbi:unnamed protein product [Chrysoparadoxa australica]
MSSINKAWATVEPYQGLLPAALGACLLLGGSVFPTLIAVVEATRSSGSWDTLKTGAKGIKDNFNATQEAARKDGSAEKEEDMDLPTLMEVRAKQLCKSFSKEHVDTALAGASMALFSVVATLRVHFAYAMTMGCTLSEIAMAWGGDVVTAKVTEVLPAEYQKLTATLVTYLFKMASFVFAWTFGRFVTAIYSSARGAQLVVDAVNRHTAVDGKEGTLSSYQLEASAGLAVIGFLFQAYFAFQLPLLLALPLIPASIVESSARLGFSLLF